MTVTERLNLVLRAVMELGVVLGFGYWGYHAGGAGALKLVLAIAAPVVGFGIWGAIDFRQFGRAAEPLRLVQELVLSGLAAVALWTSGQPGPAAVLAALSIVYHILVYATGHRLLKRTGPTPRAADETGKTGGNARYGGG